MDPRIATLRQIHPELSTAAVLPGRLDEGASGEGRGLEPLSALLEGGPAAGDAVEIVGRSSSGRFSTLLQAVSIHTRRGEAAALVDLGDSLDPHVAERAGVDLERLLWTRPPHVKAALIATELLLNTGFSLVALDLGLPPVPGGRGPEGAWVRLARAAARHRGLLLISTPYRASGTATRTILESDLRSTRWLGEPREPPLLSSIDTRLTLTKATGLGPAPPRGVRWRSGTGLR